MYLNKFQVERLEDRDVPAVAVSLLNGTLSVLGDGGANQVQIDRSAGQIVVQADGEVSLFDSAQVNFVFGSTGDGADIYTDTTGLSSAVSLGNGRDNGQFFATQNRLFIDGGNGDDRLYWITAQNGGVIQGGRGSDYVVTNATVTNLRDAADLDPVVFGLTRLTEVIDGVLYLRTTAGNDLYNITSDGQTVTVNFRLGDGSAGTLAFGEDEFSAVAALPGAGDDVVSLQGKDRLIVYGGGGNDFLSGGDGNDLLKGTAQAGSGIDVIFGNGGDDDLTGEVMFGGDGRDIFRQEDPNLFVTDAGRNELRLKRRF